MAPLGPRRLGTVGIAKGSSMEIWVDDSQPEDSIDRKWALTILDGQPDSEPFEIPSHWHKYHDEQMTIIEGEADFYVEGKHVPLRQGEQTIIPRCQVHSMKSKPGSRLVFKETTFPTGDFKEEFFLDVFAQGWPPGFWYIHRVFYDNDVYAALGVPWFLGGKFVDQTYMTVVGGIAKLVAPSKKPLEEMRKNVKDGQYQ